MKCPATTRFSLLLFAPVLAPVLLLAACQQSGEPVAPDAQETSEGPEAKPGLSAGDGVLVLPAVSDRPGAAYFTLSNGGDKPAELAAVYIEGAMRAEMHETSGGAMARLEKLAVAPGGTVKFAQGGRHVMVFQLDEDLKPGGSTEMTLTFTDGDKLSTPLRIKAMGSMDHGSGH